MNAYRITVVFLLVFCTLTTNAQALRLPAFTVVPLGTEGGIHENNLSAYMLAVDGTNEYVCLDAGTLHAGIQRAIDKNVFETDAGTVLKKYIKGYCISHPHLDHVAGLIINSPEDSAKYIYAMPYCIDVLKDNYFTWKSWANFGNEGDKPALGKYQYVALSANKEVSVENTELYVTPFVLSHSNPYRSTAFLIRRKEDYFLYLGDTGADTIEHANNLLELWKAVAPLIKARQLRAIAIEVSFPNEQPEKQLFGHLTPRLLMQELQKLGALTGEAALRNFPIMITHMKPPADKEARIIKELRADNPLDVKLVFPRQGKPLRF